VGRAREARLEILRDPELVLRLIVASELESKRASKASRNAPKHGSKKGSKAAPKTAAQQQSRDPSLTDYRRKRDFDRSPEPRGARANDAGREFVVQKHSARRLHYDLRLELDGVLKSWAVTRGPSLTVGDKRLAVQTEDHPLDYLEFEGNIPKGEYGGGSVIVWDRGRWTPLGDPQRGLDKGHLEFSLEDGRLKGRWHLVRMRKKPNEKSVPWLLIKADDEYARQPGEREITEEETTSVLSGRTNKEVAAEGELRRDHQGRAQVARVRGVVLPDIAKTKSARKGLLPIFLPPSLAAPADVPPSGPQWVHEIKYDGYRIQARIDGNNIKLLTRNNLDWTARFNSIAAALKELRLGSALLDGEIVVEDANGIPSLGNLQADLKEGRQDRFRYHVFDLLYCDGFDLTRATLLDRKEVLEQILRQVPADFPIRFSEHLEQDGRAMFEHAGRLGLEGIVSKRKDLPYRAGRGDHWIKSKAVAQQEFVILGYVPSTAAGGSVGSLPLGYYDSRGKLLYAGRVGTGWSVAQATALRKDLDNIAGPKPQFGNPLPAGVEKVRWAEPKLVCEVQYRAWSHDGILLHPVFKGLREDKPAEEVVLERTPQRTKAGGNVGVQLTHPERILWSVPGVTKQGLADFYTEIADWILPHVTGRPLSVLRCPSGTDEKCFFAKHPWAGLNEEVAPRVNVGEGKPMVAINDLMGLISLVQAGTVEIHPWGSRVEHLDKPDRLIFDLDPGEDLPWSDVIASAQVVREHLAALKLQSFVKTSGGKGLHVVVPVEPIVDWTEAKSFAFSVAKALAGARPDRFVVTVAKRARQGRVYIDYLRNERGSTAVAAYSTRALPQASVSTPLAWDELSEALRSDHFTVGNLRNRLGSLKQDPWHGFFRLRQRIPAKL
jgi:bifunctional non-homologous end joining protein LigD